MTVEDSVATAVPLSGDLLRREFMSSIGAVTLGIVTMRDRSLRIGPLELIRFGPPRTSAHGVSWPIEGGLLAAAPGGRFDITSEDGRLRATLDGYRPRLPRALYEKTQLRLHHGLVRVQLLRLAEFAPLGEPASVGARMAAAAIDIATCAGFSLVLARRRRFGAFLRITAAYHVVSWSTTGRTLGGRIMRQRVVSVDGSRLSLAQALLRLASPFQDHVSATTVIQDRL